MSQSDLIACEGCDAVYAKTHLDVDEVAICWRCNAQLRCNHSRQMKHILPLSLTCFIVFVIANVFPIADMEIQGLHSQTTLWGAVQALYNQQMTFVSALVFFTTILFPFLQLCVLLYIQLPLFGRCRPPGFQLAVRFMHHLWPWEMMDVFLLGTLVALIKLTHLATVIAGIALWAFGVLTVLLTTVISIHPRYYWQIGQIGRPKRYPTLGNCSESELLTQEVESPMDTSMAMSNIHSANSDSPKNEAPPQLTASQLEIVSCHYCGEVWRYVPNQDLFCSCCGGRLHQRKPQSLNLTWAFLIAACIMYIPSNLMPVMITSNLGGVQKDTIMSGIIYFWITGSWGLAVIVFIASFLVPILKLAILFILLISVHTRSSWRPKQRTQLYRVLELIGRWSMLDVYVVTLLTGLVHIQLFSNVTPGLGILAFSSTVVLTMLATLSFDPRLIWDAAETQTEHEYE